MSELSEDLLSERLHAHPLPDEVADLARRSIRQGERTRRRQIGAAVVVVVLLLAIPGITAALLRVSNTDRPPVTTPSTPAVPAGPRYFILDPVGRDQKTPPEITTVRGGQVWLGDKESVVLPSNQFGTVAEYGDGTAWLTRSGQKLWLSRSATALPIASDIAAITGVDPGPAGSVMVRTPDGPLIWTRDARLHRPSHPILRTTDMVATENAVWVVNGKKVFRAGMANQTGNVNVTAVSPWVDVVLGDPVADRVVVRDGKGCQAVLDGTTGVLIRRLCDLEVKTLSPDGRLAAGESLSRRTRDVIDISTGQLILRVDTEHHPVSPQMVLDRAGRLNLRVANDVILPQFMIVDLAGDAWFSTEPSMTGDFVLPNRR